jgi:phosphatidylinositol alpha-1,6-mannosyltransferase
MRTRHDLVGRRVLLTVGRLIERKGHDTVIRAMVEIRRAFPDVVYVVAGSGPDEARLRSLATSLDLPSDAVRFVGEVRQDELAVYYSLADVFVMPNRIVGSDVEGFGLVFLEAALSGRPAIGGRSGGAIDAIVDGVTGLLVDPNSGVAFTEAAHRLLSDSALAGRMGAAAKERGLRDFDYKILAPRLRAAFPLRAN